MGTFDITYPDLYHVLMRRRSTVKEFLASENIADKTTLLKWIESAKTTWAISDSFYNEADAIFSSKIIEESQDQVKNDEPIKEIENTEEEKEDKTEFSAPKHIKRNKQQKLSED